MIFHHHHHHHHHLRLVLLLLLQGCEVPHSIFTFSFPRTRFSLSLSLVLSVSPRSFHRPSFFYFFFNTYFGARLSFSWSVRSSPSSGVVCECGSEARPGRSNKRNQVCHFLDLSRSFHRDLISLRGEDNIMYIRMYVWWEIERMEI